MGLPESVRIDNAPYFRNKFEEFCKDMGVMINYTSPYHHKSNGAAERAVKSCKELLSKSKDYTDFKKRLLELNSNPTLGSQYSPAEIFFGRRVKTFMPVSKKKLTERIPVKELEKEMGKVNQRRTQVNKLRNRKWHDRENFKVGEPVLFKKYQVQGDKMRRFPNRGVISEVLEDGRSYEIATETLLFYRNKAHIVRDYSRIQ